MLHPVLHLLATRPGWVAEHAEAYVQLAAVEAGAAAAAAQRSVVLGATALCATGVAAVLGGVSLLLWAALPTLPADTLWLLWAVPALPLAVALLAAVLMQSRSAPGFAVLREQLQIDLALLRRTPAAQAPTTPP